MQLNPEIAYALGGPFTTDQAALIVSSVADHAIDQPPAVELTEVPDPDRPTGVSLPDPIEEDDHDSDTCPYCAGI